MIHETPILKIRHATSENNEKLYPLKNFENKYFSKTGYDEIILFSFPHGGAPNFKLSIVITYLISNFIENIVLLSVNLPIFL